MKYSLLFLALICSGCCQTDEMRKERDESRSEALMWKNALRNVQRSDKESINLCFGSTSLLQEELDRTKRKEKP